MSKLKQMANKLEITWATIVKGLCATIVFLAGLWLQQFWLNRNYSIEQAKQATDITALKAELSQHQQQNIVTRQENNDAHILILNALGNMDKKIDKTLDNQRVILGRE